MTASIEALYIFDDQRQCILEHIYNGRPPKPQELRSSFFSHAASNQPSVLYLPELNPATAAYSIRHTNLLLIATCTTDTHALAILEFLRKVVDIFDDFLGSPLLAHKIEENYEVIGQLLAEICDGGTVCNTEPNALRESVEVSSMLGKLFNQVGIASGSSTLSGSSSLSSALKTNPIPLQNQPSIPWRRPNVRHTSNELYVDLIETLHIVSAPSGRPISARAHGSILFTAKISGVPDILLSLSAPGGSSTQKHSGISRTMSLPSFHPCVRLAKWKERPGELSFIPPDGKFMLTGYEVDLLPYSFTNDESLPARGKESKLFLPATVDLRTGLGQSGMDFEAKLTLNTNFPGVPTSTSGGTSSLRPGSGLRRDLSTQNAPFSFPGVGMSAGTTSAPTLEAVSVSIPLPPEVRNVTDFRASRGDATFNLATCTIEWRIPTHTKDAGSTSGTATLTGTISGPLTEDATVENDPTMEEYYPSSPAYGARTEPVGGSAQGRGNGKKHLMPRTVNTSFMVKGWLPSGIKVDALTIDTKRSRGLGEGVRPYKGVKYICVSKGGVERRV